MPEPLGSIVATVTLVGSLVFLLVLSIVVNLPKQVVGRQTVTLYSGDGSVISTWQAVLSVNTRYDSNDVAFKDPVSRQALVLHGTIVIDDGEFNWNRPPKATHVVMLYGLTKDPIRCWEAANVETNQNDRIVFIDAKTGHGVTVYGTTVTQRLPTS